MTQSNEKKTWINFIKPQVLIILIGLLSLKNLKLIKSSDIIFNPTSLDQSTLHQTLNQQPHPHPFDNLNEFNPQLESEQSQSQEVPLLTNHHHHQNLLPSTNKDLHQSTSTQSFFGRCIQTIKRWWNRLLNFLLKGAGEHGQLGEWISTLFFFHNHRPFQSRYTAYFFLSPFLLIPFCYCELSSRRNQTKASYWNGSQL